MLTYSFEALGSDCLYEHLYKCIKNDILSGTLPIDMRLPSKRSFSKNLGVSIITVENAYAQLVAEGYLYSIPKKGYFVASLDSFIDLPKQVESIKKETADSQINSAVPYSYFADFASNQTNSEKFPFSTWVKLMREIMADNADELMTNSPGNGIVKLRVAIADHLKQFRGMHVSPDQIIVGAGTEYLYGLLIQLLGRDCIYAVEDPGYRKISQIYESNDVPCRYIPMDKYGLLVDALEESQADILHISPSHHYPTGLITPISRRYELLAWASRSKRRYIIEDDYDCEFRFMGKPIPSLQSIDVMKKIIYINTFTKSLASTIRISYMVLPLHLVTDFHEKLSFYSCTVSNFEQYTLAKFIKDGYFEKHINRMRNFYRNQRDILMECINTIKYFSTARITEEDSGLHFLLHLSTNLSDTEIIENAKQKGIKISCLAQYYMNCPPDAANTLIINYSGIASSKMEEAVRRLADSLTTLDDLAP